MKYAIKIRSIIWRKISIYSVQGLPVGSNNVGFDVIGTKNLMSHYESDGDYVNYKVSRD